MFKSFGLVTIANQSQFGWPFLKIGWTVYLWLYTELHCLIGQNDLTKVYLIGHFDKLVGKWSVASCSFVFCV